MAFTLSPGVSVNEINLNTYVPAIATTGAVIAGPFTWGPANVKTLVDSETTLVNTFGEPDNTTANTFFTADSFLQYGNNLNVVRVVSTSARNAAVLNDSITYIAITNPGAGYVHVPTLAFSSGSATATATVANGEITGVTITNPASGYNLSAPPTITVTATGGDTITILAVLTPTVGLQIQNETQYLANYAAGQLGDSAGEFCAKYPGKLGNGIQISICDDPTQFATWPWRMYFSGAPGTSAYASNVGGSGDLLHIVVIDSLGLISGTPGSVLETFGFVSKAVDALNAQGQSIYYPNVINTTSNWIRWLNFPSTVNNWGVTASGTAFQDLYVSGTAATLNVLATSSGLVYTSRIAGTNGNYINIVYVNPATNNTLNVVVTGAGTSGSHYVITVNLGYASSAITSTAAQVLAAINGTVAAAALVEVAYAPGYAGTSIVTAYTSTPLSGGTSSVTYEVILEGGISNNSSVTDGQIEAGYNLFNVEDFTFGLILTADHDTTVVNYCITEIAETLMNSVVFVSPPSNLVINNAGNEATSLVTWRNTFSNSTYAFLDGNWIYKYDKWNDVYRYVPANGDVAGLCVRTDMTRDPWFSPAGLNRGILKGAVGLAWNPNQVYRDLLYTNQINPICSFVGQGILLWGDIMLTSQPSAFDRINVRRLFIVIEQAIALAAKYTLFEINDATTRAQFVGLIDPYLRDIQGRQGLYAYQIVCNSTNNTNAMIDAHQFQGDIYLQPTKSINYITLNFIATPTGINFTEIVGQY